MPDQRASEQDEPGRDMIGRSATQIQSTPQGLQLAPPLEQPTTKSSSQELPTREFLDKNYRKPELQKRCLDLGLANIWTTKHQLIDMILKHSGAKLKEGPHDATHSPVTPSGVIHTDLAPPQVTHSTATPSEVTHTYRAPLEDRHSPASLREFEHADLTQGGVDMMDIARKIETITSKLEIKDMEIELLNTEIKTAYQTINLLQQRVMDLEQRCCGRDDHESSTATSTSSKSCLLLGDTNLRPILFSDLHNNCCVRTIHDANMDLITSWVTQKLDRIPSECILYNGIYDILEGSSPSTILDNLGSLISALKDKNNSMKIYICQIVPSSMCHDINVKIEEYNDQLTKWCDTNGITVIETVPTFKLGTGELDDLCFDIKNDSYSELNRLGAIKLLGVIKKQCPEFQLCTNWEQVKRTNMNNAQQREKRSTETTNLTRSSRTAILHAGLPALTTPRHQADSRIHNQRHSYAQNITTNRAPHDTYTTSQRALTNHRAASTTTPRVSTSPAFVRPTRERGWGTAVVRGSNTYATALRRTPEERRHTVHYHSRTHSPGAREWSRNNLPRHHTSTPVFEEQETYGGVQHYDQADRYIQNNSSRYQITNMNYEYKKRGCYNCGEYNHVQMNCRFDHKLLCGNCKRLGHKSRLCHNYNT